ncbi:hypothetical protein HK099_003944 [Clydaea vesicula]|uniref:SGF29 C-terminal domain-containing protein n=1 Tax=Clydaea vesicula TaxID=447962 RepID=A0AAD5U145_9FUNG|nr:hypothetical protein HK099_003944 [Clydaea vesicula]
MISLLILIAAKLERISAIYDTVASYQRTLEDLIKKAVILIDLTQSQSSKLKRFNPNDQGGKKYEVEDAEDDELDGQRKRYTFPVQNIIPLANKKKELQPKSKCLALYPNSTCFYPATICATPAMNRDPSHPNHYILQFNDDNSMERFVEENYFVEMFGQPPKPPTAKEANQNRKYVIKIFVHCVVAGAALRIVPFLIDQLKN